MPPEPVTLRRRYDDCRGASDNRTADVSASSICSRRRADLFLFGWSVIARSGHQNNGRRYAGAAVFNGLDPLAGLFIGILGTILVQSSSASTSVIVGLVAARALKIDDAVPMIMGANIGTTVTNTLVSLAHIRQSEEFKRAFSVATVHDFFNVIAVAILLPIELATGVLTTIAESISTQLLGNAGTEWKSPIKQLVKEPVGWIQDLWEGAGTSSNVLGTLVVGSGLVIVLLALAFITRNMRLLVAERVERTLNIVLSKGAGMVAMLLGVIVTIAVQSSSITTSVLIPMLAAGVLSLRNAFPVTLGANVGTTITALLAALATDAPEALTIALVHTIFNVVGILLVYPLPAIRKIPIRAAERLAAVAVERRTYAVVYVAVAFVVIPLVGVALLN